MDQAEHCLTFLVLFPRQLSDAPVLAFLDPDQFPTISA